MLIIEKKSKSTICPFTLNGPRAYGCQGTRCAAFRWTWGNKHGTTLKTKLGESVGFCGLVGEPEQIQTMKQLPELTDQLPIITEDDGCEVI